VKDVELILIMRFIIIRDAWIIRTRQDILDKSYVILVIVQLNQKYTTYGYRMIFKDNLKKFMFISDIKEKVSNKKNQHH
jgi:hypothetical protein